MASATAASAQALHAIVGALGPDGAISSESQDPPECLRSYSWDQALATAILAVAADGDVFDRARDALLTRQHPDGYMPVMVCVGSVGKGDLRPDPSATAAAVAVLAGLVNRGHPRIDPTTVKPALEKALAWMNTVWLENVKGGYGIAPGSSQAYTEGTALALMAGIELENLFPGCCRKRNIKAAKLLASNRVWRSDHFARGFSVGTIDDDMTGPHTHPPLSVLALGEAARAYPGKTPDPACCDPIPWLRKHFTRVTTSAGRAVEALGDRLVLIDDTGMLFGCDGGGFGAAPGSLTCPAGSVRRADPDPRQGGCYSPYDPSCAVAVDSLPVVSRIAQSSNTEITLLTALAAMSLARSGDAAFLLNGALALQRPSGAVIAIAGPHVAAPGWALLWPVNHRVQQYGYTALLALALNGINPFALGRGGVLTHTLPVGLSLPQDHFDPKEFPLNALLPDPQSGRITPGQGGRLTVVHQARREGWVRVYTPAYDDAPWPAACYRLGVSVHGHGWPHYEMVTMNSRGLTHGRRFYDGLSDLPRVLDIPRRLASSGRWNSMPTIGRLR